MSRTDPLVDVLCFDRAPSGQVIVARRTFVNVFEKIAFLDRWATRDAPSFAWANPARDAAERLARLRSIHDAIRLVLPYRTDEELHGECEALGSPRYIAEANEGGDCDKHATLGAALARAQGALAALVALGGTELEPEHLALAVAPDRASARTPPARWYGWAHDRELPPGWWWSETTIAAAFGEAPYEAGVRLLARRRDLGA